MQNSRYHYTIMHGYEQLVAQQLFRRIAENHATGILLLDYDGTLAPFVADPAKARPYPGVTEVLAGLPAEGPGRPILVSGRPPHEVATLAGLDPVPEIWGCHGAERLLPGGLPSPGKDALDPPGKAAALDATLAEAGKAATEAFPQARLERKSCSLAAHWRGVDEGAARAGREALARVWKPFLGEDFELLDFAAGLEMRRSGFHKGRAVERIKAENPDAALVYVGDDVTDEDAFRALGENDLGVLVRTGERESAAPFVLEPPEELLRFLEFWRRLHEGKGARPASAYKEQSS